MLKGSFNFTNTSEMNIQKMINELLRTVSFEQENIYRCLQQAKFYGKVLDLGCGPGGSTQILAKYESVDCVYGVDIEPRFIEYAKKYMCGKHTEYYVGDCYKIPFPDNFFDCCYSRYVFQHLAAPEAALEEIRRVVKPGGMIGIHDVDYDLVTHFPPVPYASKIKKINYLIKKYQGGDIYIGRKLERLMRLSGVESVQTIMTQTDSRNDSSFIDLFINSENNRDFLIEHQLMKPYEIDSFLENARKLSKDPTAYFCVGNYFVYGRN